MPCSTVRSGSRRAYLGTEPIKPQFVAVGVEAEAEAGMWPVRSLRVPKSVHVAAQQETIAHWCPASIPIAATVQSADGRPPPC